MQESQRLILLQHSEARKTFLRRKGGWDWLPYRLNDAGQVRCPVCGVGMLELKPRVHPWTRPEGGCRYWLCERSGVTFFGDADGIDFVSYSQGLLNLAQEESDGGSF